MIFLLLSLFLLFRKDYQSEKIEGTCEIGK